MKELHLRIDPIVLIVAYTVLGELKLISYIDMLTHNTS